jgi:threonine aldolase
MAQLLYNEIKEVPKIKITQKVETNAIFAIVPKEYINLLQKEYFFHVNNEQISEVRWMCSFDTTERDIMNFSKLIKKTVV